MEFSRFIDFGVDGYDLGLYDLFSDLYDPEWIEYEHDIFSVCVDNGSVYIRRATDSEDERPYTEHSKPIPPNFPAIHTWGGYVVEPMKNGKIEGEYYVAMCEMYGYAYQKISKVNATLEVNPDDVYIDNLYTFKDWKNLRKNLLSIDLDAPIKPITFTPHPTDSILYKTGLIDLTKNKLVHCEFAIIQKQQPQLVCTFYVTCRTGKVMYVNGNTLRTIANSWEDFKALPQNTEKFGGISANAIKWF